MQNLFVTYFNETEKNKEGKNFERRCSEDKNYLTEEKENIISLGKNIQTETYQLTIHNKFILQIQNKKLFKEYLYHSVCPSEKYSGESKLKLKTVSHLLNSIVMIFPFINIRANYENI